MRVLAIRHVPYEGLGLIEPALAARGIGLEWEEIGARVDDERLKEFAGLILMGGPMSVNDPEPWVEAELDLILHAAKRDLPILGVCLGAQLIAKAFGARVYRNTVKEIGWFETRWTEAAASDPLLCGLPDPCQIFQWHGETFDLPANSVWLARTQTCAHQAFRIGHRVWGLQFHLEVTPEMIQEWVRQDADDRETSELSEVIDAYLHAEAQARLAEQVFGRWAGKVADEMKPGCPIGASK